MGSSPSKKKPDQPPHYGSQPPGGPPNYQSMPPPNFQSPAEGQHNPQNLQQNYPGQRPSSQYPPPQQQMPSSMPPNYSRVPQNQQIPPVRPQLPGNAPPNYPGQSQPNLYPPSVQPMSPLASNPNEIKNPQYPPQYGAKIPSNYSPHNPNIGQSFGPDQRPQNYPNPYNPNIPPNPNNAPGYGNINPPSNFYPSQQIPGATPHTNQPTNYPGNQNIPQYPSNYVGNPSNTNIPIPNSFSQYPPQTPNQNIQNQNPNQIPSNIPQNQIYPGQTSSFTSQFPSQNPSNPPPSQYPPNFQNQNNQFQANNIPFQNNPSNYPNPNFSQPLIPQNQYNSPGQPPYPVDPNAPPIPAFPQYQLNNNYGVFPQSYQVNDPIYHHEVIHLSKPISTIPYSDLFSPKLPTEYEVHSPIDGVPIKRIISPVRSLTPPLRRYVSPSRIITHTNIPEYEFPSNPPLTEAPRLISSRIIPVDYSSDIVHDPYLTERLNLDPLPPTYLAHPQAIEYPLTDIPSRGKLVSRQIIDANMRDNRFQYLPSKTFSPSRINTYTQYKNYEVPISPNVEANYPLGLVQEGNEIAREVPINYVGEINQMQNIPRGTLLNYEFPSVKIQKRQLPTENEFIDNHLSGGNKPRML